MIQTVIMMFTLVATFWCLLWSIALDRASSSAQARRRVVLKDSSPFEISSPETYERRYGSRLPF